MNAMPYLSFSVFSGNPFAFLFIAFIWRKEWDIKGRCKKQEMEWNIKDGNWLEELSDSFLMLGRFHLKEISCKAHTILYKLPGDPQGTIRQENYALNRFKGIYGPTNAYMRCLKVMTEKWQETGQKGKQNLESCQELSCSFSAHLTGWKHL